MTGLTVIPANPLVIPANAGISPLAHPRSRVGARDDELPTPVIPAKAGISQHTHAHPRSRVGARDDELVRRAAS